MNYFEDEKKEYCNGCALCQNMCPQNCISMQEDYLGFIYPTIDKDKCINCKKCERICSNICIEYNKPGVAYAVVNRNEDELKKSASGGMFLVLAKYVIKQGGVVCGVRYDTNLNAVFDVAETVDDCYKFCGSKYVRAKINDIYSKIKRYLESGRIVLFVGTSCQTNAVKIFSEKYNNILLYSGSVFKTKNLSFYNESMLRVEREPPSTTVTNVMLHSVQLLLRHRRRA